MDQRRRRASGQNRPGSAEDKGSGCRRVNNRVERERRRPERQGSPKDKGFDRRTHRGRMVIGYGWTREGVARLTRIALGQLRTGGCVAVGSISASSGRDGDRRDGVRLRTWDCNGRRQRRRRQGHYCPRGW